MNNENLFIKKEGNEQPRPNKTDQIQSKDTSIKKALKQEVMTVYYGWKFGRKQEQQKYSIKQN